MLEQIHADNAFDASPVSFEVPREDNTSLIWPSLHVHGLVDASRELRSQYPDWLTDLSRLAREETTALLAVDSAEEGNEAVAQCPSPDRIWLLGGHQPELFHPGVWFKNFLLHAIASRLAIEGEVVLPLHITIDHDLAKPSSLRTTCRDSGRLQHKMRPIPLRSSGADELPWELTKFAPERRTEWSEWIGNLVSDCHSIGVQPLIGDLQDRWFARLEESANLGEAFSGFRQSVEQSVGVRNAELPMSRLCGTQAFGEFFRRLANRDSNLWEHYNNARQQYRSWRRISNPVQPVPALQQSGPWMELPFWIYHRSKSIPRSKLWIRWQGDFADLASEPGEDAAWLKTVNLDGSDWHPTWSDIQESGLCIRPRALMTTLYLRYVLADLFLHGIGGGIYDTLTDEIAHRVWGISRLPMMVASASLHLPIRDPATSSIPLVGNEEDLIDEVSEPIETRWSQHQRELHRMRSAPESFLDPNDRAHAELLRRHRIMLERRKAETGSRAEWHREMGKLRSAIRLAVDEESQRLRLVSNDLMEERRLQRISRSREVPFILFPQIDVVKRLKSLLPLAFD